jgi:hypothetical protein
MSLFGKILTIINLLGAAGLVYLASVNYGKRQQWAYTVMRYDLMLKGIPLEADELDHRGLQIVDQLTDDTLRELFSNVGGNPSRTQLDEVNAVRSRIDGAVAAQEADKRAQSLLLSGILMPFADTLLERDEYLAIQAYFRDATTLQALENRYNTALTEAKRPGASGPDRSFEMAFRLATRVQGGVPSESITNFIAAKLPQDAAAPVNMKALLAEATEAQRQVMLQRLDTLFATALTTAEQSTSAAQGRPRNSQTSQRAAIARLLFGLSRPLSTSEEERARYQARVFVVCGIKTGLNAIAERSAALRTINAQIESAIDDERTQFLSDEYVLLESARDIAARWQSEVASIADNNAKWNTQSATVKQRALDVEKAEAELKQSLAETEKSIAQLRAATEKTRQARIEARDLLLKLGERERLIQQLDQQVKQAETKTTQR